MRCPGNRDTVRASSRGRLRYIFTLLLGVCSMSAGCKPVVNFFAFHPNDSYAVPSASLPAGTQEIFFETEDDVRIQALFLRNPASKTVTIYFHGNAGNVYHRLRDYERLRRLGTSVFAVSYRGYAKSAGSPSEDGIYRDARAAFDHVTKNLSYSPSRIFIFGRSIGSTAAVDLAQDKAVAGLILVSPLSSARDQADAMGLGFAAGLSGGAFENERKIERVTAPLLVIHGTRDRIIPIAMGRAVFDAANSRKYFHEIEGAGHNDLSSRFAETYWGIVLTFFERFPVP